MQSLLIELLRPVHIAAGFTAFFIAPVAMIARKGAEIVAAIVATVWFAANPVAAEPTGTIKGTVTHAKTGEPLIGVNVILTNTTRGAATSDKGEFIITHVPAGNYCVAFQIMGFERLIKPDVIVRPGRITFLNAQLNETALKLDEVTVRAAYFQKQEEEPLSAFHFNAEEIRRAPGSAGDISRILAALPSVAQVYDNANDLMVRGGSPFENGFYVDNIPIPNINHFPVQGATGGPIGLLNVDFIDDVHFYTGGFSAAYGDRLSSIIDIKFRDGNRDEMDLQLDANMAGFGAIAEGPLGAGKGSWFLSGRRSYLDLIVGAIGTGVAPRYGDLQGKVRYNLSPRHSLTALNLFGASVYKMDEDEAKDNGESAFGEYNARQNSFGVNWRALWSGSGFSNTSLSYAFIRNENLWNDVSSHALSNRDKSLEGAYTLRNVNYIQLDRSNKLEFGAELKYEIADYDYFFDADTNRLGELVPELTVAEEFHSSKTGAFLTYISNPIAQVTATFGLRADYFSFNANFHLSPRFSASWQLGDRVSLNAAAGWFYQPLPTFILSQEPGNKELADPASTHAVIGVDYQLSPDTKLTVELYNKSYRNLPLEPADPALSVIDDGRMFSYFRRYYGLVDDGEAYSRGIELLVQKKLARDLYGLASASFFRSRYRDYLGNWRDRLYDNRYVMTVIGGYKPNNKWEVSVRWNFAGGVPYTPFDSEMSQAFNTGIIDSERINEERYPNYHSLSLRCDRRFLFQNSSIVTYLSMWNLYNRKNVAMYYWNEIERHQDTTYQWSFLPVFGLEYEF